MLNQYSHLLFKNYDSVHFFPFYISLTLTKKLQAFHIIHKSIYFPVTTVNKTYLDQSDPKVTCECTALELCIKPMFTVLKPSPFTLNDLCVCKCIWFSVI